jgi:GNAT superfamily N-acetyltransferase
MGSDADAIGDAHAESWLAAYGEIFEPEFLVAAAESRRTGWRNVLPHLLVPPNVLLVGELEGRVVAFGHAAPSEEPGTVEVCGFYAHPAAWGSGIATVLMTELLLDAGGSFDHAMLWTFRDAGRARRFYEKVGYTVTGRERAEELTNWSTGTSVTRPAVQYRANVTRLRSGSSSTQTPQVPQG